MYPHLLFLRSGDRAGLWSRSKRDRRGGLNAAGKLESKKPTVTSVKGQKEIEIRLDKEGQERPFFKLGIREQIAGVGISPIGRNPIAVVNFCACDSNRDLLKGLRSPVALMNGFGLLSPKVCLGTQQRSRNPAQNNQRQ